MVGPASVGGDGIGTVISLVRNTSPVSSYGMILGKLLEFPFTRLIKTVSGSVMVRSMIDRGMLLLGYVPHNIEHRVTSGSEGRKMVHQSLVLGNKHTNVTSERGLGAPGLPRCHCIPKFRKKYVYSLTSHTLHRTKKDMVPLQLPS